MSKVWKCKETGKLFLGKPHPQLCDTLLIRTDNNGKQEGCCRLKGWDNDCDAIECVIRSVKDEEKIQELVGVIRSTASEIDSGYAENELIKTTGAILDLLKGEGDDSDS